MSSFVGNEFHMFFAHVFIYFIYLFIYFYFFMCLFIYSFIDRAIARPIR